MHTTPPSLLDALRHRADQVGWVRFVNLYSPLLCHWARRLGLLDAEVDDFVQDVFLLLVRKLPDFEYQPSQRFRGWLWTLTVNRLRETRRRKALPNEPVADLDERLQVDVSCDLDEAEYRQYVVSRALQLMQSEFETTTWRAFWESTTNERPAREVAAELGMTVDAVYASKSRVLRRLRQELEGLLD